MGPVIRVRRGWLITGGFIEQRCSQESNFGTIVIYILVNRLHEHLLNKVPGNDAGVKEWIKRWIRIQSNTNSILHENQILSSSGTNRLPSYLLSSREFLDSLVANYDNTQPMNPEYLET